MLTFLLIASAAPVAARAASDVPQRLLPKDAASLPGERETVRGCSEAVLYVPSSSEPISDPRGASYGADCHVYLSENGLLVRRFSVHVPDRLGLPFAKKAGRMLALVWGGANRRLGTAANGLRKGVVDVWLTRGGQPGGEQVRSDIYIYDFMAERMGIEWARELAHEYGHFLLPGASGYIEPENWGNGVLGERLFLRWLQEDVSGGRVEEKELPFVNSADLLDYCQKQPDALTERIATRGPDATSLRGKDRRSMDEFTALLLYADATYGSRSLFDLLDFLPQSAIVGVGGGDFLNALELWVSNSRELETLIPAGGTMLYLPKGSYAVSQPSAGSTPTSKTSALSAGTGAAVTRQAEGGWKVVVSTPGWRKVALVGVAAKSSLHWERL